MHYALMWEGWSKGEEGRRKGGVREVEGRGNTAG